MRSTAALFAVLALAVFGWGLRGSASWAPRGRFLTDAMQADLGEALINRAHNRTSAPSYRMPFVPLLEADALLRTPPGALTAALAGIALLSALLTFALGLALGGPWAGLAAAAVAQAIFLAQPKSSGIGKQFVLTPLVLLAALALERRARRPGRGTSAVAGAAIGVTLLSRGVLFFLPPLLAAGEIRGPGAPRARWGRAAGLLLACALVLAPWWIMNGVVLRRFVPLENGSADLNIATGAVGIVRGGHGDPKALTGGAPALSWAARRVLREPGIFFRGVAARLRRVIGLQAWLFVFAALGLALRRREPGARAIGFLCAYWIGVHVLMPVEDDYFWPLWPLLAALAASPLAFLPAPPERAPKVLARASVTIAAVLAGLMAARCGWNALAYAAAAARRPPTSDQALDEALARRPGDPWVAMLQARRLLRRGDARGAAAALASSGAALAGSHRFRLLLEWAQAKAGDPAALLADTLPPPGVRENFDDDVLERLPLSQAVILERAGRRREALARVASARAAWLSWQGLLANLGEPEANGVQSALLKRASADFLDRVDQDFDDEAPADARLAAELAARDAGGFAPWRRLAERHLKDRDAAERVELTEAESLARAAEDFHWLHLAWLEQGEPARAERDLRRALAAEPARALYWADLGVLRYGRGDARGAEADLRRALELDPALPSAALSLGAILEGSRRAGEARALYERVLDAGVADAGMNAALVEARGRVNASAPRR